MSIEAMSVVLNMDGLEPVEKLVLLGIANHDGDGGAWPSIDTLARYSCRSRRTVHTVLAKLVDKGLVSYERNAGGTRKTRNDQRPNLYTLHLDNGVQPTAPREPQRGAAQRVNGVQSEAERGAACTAPEPSTLETPVEPSPTRASEQLSLVARPVTPREDPRIEAWFEAFWQAYPRREGKPAARRAFKAALKRGADLQAMGAGLRVWGAHWAERNDPQFIPHPSTWLNQERWNDTPPPLAAPRSGSVLERARQRRESKRAIVDTTVSG